MRRRAHRSGFDLHFVYVDALSYIGRYAGELEDKYAGRSMKTVYGSPIIGVQGLDNLVEWATEANVPLRVNAILIEKKYFCHRASYG